MKKDFKYIFTKLITMKTTKLKSLPNDFLEKESELTLVINLNTMSNGNI